MQTNIIPPTSLLKNFVKSYWILEGVKSDTPEKNTIVPDGHMKLIFHYRDPYKHWIDSEKNVLLPRCFLIGQLTRPYVVEPTGDTGTFIVCFHPSGLSSFTNIPIKDIENTAVPLTHIFGVDGEVLAKNILEAKDTSQRIAIIEKFLLEYLMQPKNVDKIFDSALEMIFSTQSTRFTEILPKNRRQIERKFSRGIGLPPKQLSKIIRLQSVLKILLTEKDVNFTQIAHENGYYDQAHFIKDFKEFTGLTPSEFYGDDLRMSLIFEDKK